MTPGWYIRRLQVMDAGEIVWRVRNAATQLRWRARRGSRWPVPPVAPTAARWAGGALPAGSVPAAGSRKLVAAAEAVLDGSWPVFGTRADVSGDAPNWFADPTTGRRAPAGEYCFAVPYRDEARVGNAKRLWELSRLHHVTVLAAAFQQTGDARFAERALAHVQSWCAANPPLCGIHWVSGIELGIRLLSLVWTRRLLDGFPGAARAFEGAPSFRRQLHAHQAWIAAFHSRGTSANNHLVAEMAGLLAAGLAFPLFGDSGQWARFAADALAREVEQQTFPDGLNKEMAAGYHVFALELFLVAGREADAAGAPFGDAYWFAVRAMADALAATVDSSLSTARQGDDDDGRALLLDAPGKPAARAVLEACARVVGPAPWWPRLGKESIGAALLEGVAPPRVLLNGRPAARPNAFHVAGVTILRGAASDEDEIWCRFDHGPHGYLATAAHAHADALSFELRHGGRPVLVDPGTYCYHGERAWRDYFRSTVAHNALEVFGRDLAQAGGPFLWLTRPRARLLMSCGVHGGDAGVVEAVHDGYATDGILHRRRLVLDRCGRSLDIVDTVEATHGRRSPARASSGAFATPRDAAAPHGALPVRLAFSLHPDVACDLREDRAELAWDAAGGCRRSAVLLLPPTLRWAVHRGEMDPILGWYSARFGHKEPAPLLLGAGFVALGAPLRSRIAFGAAADGIDGAGSHDGRTVRPEATSGGCDRDDGWKRDRWPPQPVAGAVSWPVGSPRHQGGPSGSIDPRLETRLGPLQHRHSGQTDKRRC